MKTTLIASTLLFTLTAGCAGEFNDTSPQEDDDVTTLAIVGGRDTSVNEVPWQVQVMEKLASRPVPHCGGSLIAPNWVLTAAHCTRGTDPARHVVLAGSSKLETRENEGQFGIRLQAKRVIIHEQWNGKTKDGFDIALIELERELPLGGGIQTIPLVDTAAASRGVTQPDEPSLVSGFGLLSEGGADPENLQSLVQPIVATRDAARSIFYRNLLPSMISAGFVEESGRGACNADSGGPLVVGMGSEPLLAGIVSFSGQGCAREKVPAIYTRVESFVPWIKQHVPEARTSLKRGSNLTDLSTYAGAREVFELTQRGIVSGYPDSTFLPTNSMTRAEVAAVLAQAFGNRPATSQVRSFEDMPQDHWAKDAVAIASSRGFINGYQDGTFRPGQTMTRQEAMVALANGLNLPTPTEAQKQTLRALPGGRDVADWAIDRVTAAHVAGLLKNVNLTSERHNLAPTEQLQRGQLASFVYHALEQ